MGLIDSLKGWKNEGVDMEKLIFLLLLSALLLPLQSCGANDEKGSGEESDSVDDTGDNDGNGDDDNDDDDNDDNDNDNDNDDNDDGADDDDSDGAPVLSNGYWYPSIVGAEMTSTLYFFVCDPDDDLSGGYFCLDADCLGPGYIDARIFWNDFIGGAPSCPDCSAPCLIDLEFYFGEPNFKGASSVEYCADIWAKDGNGNISNTLDDICITIPFL